MAMSGLACRKAMVGTGQRISVHFDINGLRNRQSHLVGHLFPTFKAHFQVNWYLPGALIESSLSGGCS